MPVMCAGGTNLDNISHHSLLDGPSTCSGSPFPTQRTTGQGKPHTRAFASCVGFWSRWRLPACLLRVGVRLVVKTQQSARDPDSRLQIDDGGVPATSVHEACPHDVGLPSNAGQSQLHPGRCRWRVVRSDALQGEVPTGNCSPWSRRPVPRGPLRESQRLRRMGSPGP